VPDFLLDKEVISLDMTALMAGTTLRGMFEERIKGVLNEIKTSGNYILFIDNIGSVLNDRGRNDYDISSMLSNSLENGWNIEETDANLITEISQVFIFDNDDICKLIDLDSFCKNIIHYSRLYYRRYKVKIKERKNKSTSREEKIEYNIMLGVLSVIKTKKIAYSRNKYLDEAYDLISEKNYNKSKYLYGDKSLNPKFSLMEVRAVSDWLFYKIMKLQNVKSPTPQKSSSTAKNVIRSLTTSLLGKQPLKPSDFDTQIQNYQNHIQN